jgi:hypothetical protein
MPRSRKATNEIQRLQDEISQEIAGDAPEIAEMVFGSARDQPDVVAVRNERLDDVYRQAYLKDDRQWLQGEARRDPEQFLKVAERIGVKVPQVLPGMQSPVPPPDAFVKAAGATPPAAPPPPIAPGMPVVSPMVPPIPQAAPLAPTYPVPPVGPPVILGPNGQPLPPSGVI